MIVTDLLNKRLDWLPLTRRSVVQYLFVVLVVGQVLAVAPLVRLVDWAFRASG
jgi:hypothetical protein